MTDNFPEMILNNNDFDIPAGLYRVTEDGRLLSANKELARMFGFETTEELLNQRVSLNYVFPEHRDNLLDQLKTTGNVKDFKTRMRKKDGSELWVSVSARALFDSNKRLLYYDGIVQDVTDQIVAEHKLETERHKYEESLMQAKKKAEEADKLKTAFLANVSHEIRTPMNSIIGFSEFLNDPHISREDLNDFINIIQQNGNALIHLIDDIMDMAKIDAGELRLDMQEYEVNDLLSNMFHTIVPGLKLKSSNLIKPLLNLPYQDKKLFLKTDVQRIRQILYNLLSNAFKFTDRGTIELGYKLRSNGNICIYVKDTGIGIPKDKRDIIFDPFRQIDQSTTRKYSGTGIGLTITRKLARMLGGDIKLESNDEQGSMFCCNFPLQNSNIMTDEPKKENTTKTSKPKLDLSGKTVIIAEDFESNYLFLKAALKSSNANIIWCKNGEETLKALNNGHHIDLILMDVQMPVMSGNDAVVKIRESGNDIPVIAQTAYATNKEIEACMKAGYNDYLVKPIRVRKLLETIEKYL